MILAAFPTGVVNITVNGLHQWDYGQQLKIKAPDLPAMVEVHFACAGMDEAIVRSCSVANGEGTVAIPDKCLEQTSPVYAWIYEIDGTAGTTTKTILLNVIARARPQTGEDIPVEISDKYTEAVTAMNEAVERVMEGDVTVKHAQSADRASSALTAGSADTAESAIVAPEKGTHTEDFDKNDGQAFSFANTNGFGVKGGTTNGYFKLWNLLNPDDGKHYCSLVPSMDGKQTLGDATRSFRSVFAKKIITNGVDIAKTVLWSGSVEVTNYNDPVFLYLGEFDVFADQFVTFEFQREGTIYKFRTLPISILDVGTIEVDLPGDAKLKIQVSRDDNSYSLVLSILSSTAKNYYLTKVTKEG